MCFEVIAEYADAESAMRFVTAVAPVIPVVTVVTAVKSVAATVTAPVRPWTLVTLALSVPLLTERPLPTTTPPAEVVVALGRV